MKRYVLTGTPGAGKTAILRLLERLGHAVVEEAATAVIALRHAQGEPHPSGPGFIDEIVALQRQRQVQAAGTGVPIQFFDRSPICTHALSRYSGCPLSPALAAEIDRIRRQELYQRTVFFIRNLGFTEPTAARRISFADSLRFERIHEDTYREYGYELVEIPPAALAGRVAMITDRLGLAGPIGAPVAGELATG